MFRLCLVLTLAALALAAQEKVVLDYDTPVDAALQAKIEALDARLRDKYSMTTEQTAVGVIDLKTARLALLRPDREEYAASLAKIGILLAYFDAHPEAAEHIDPAAERELGQMARNSSNEMAAKYSHELGLKNIQKVLSEKYGFYDAKRGGGDLGRQTLRQGNRALWQPRGGQLARGNRAAGHALLHHARTGAARVARGLDRDAQDLRVSSAQAR